MRSTQDPIRGLQKYIEDWGLATEEELKTIDKESKAEVDKAVEEANRYVIKNRFPEIVEREGGVGLNASTSLDTTQYFYSFPINRFELWAYLESSRFMHPVFREFYKERDVVHEERRLRIDSSPIGRMVEQFLAAAYTAHPYGRSGVGCAVRGQCAAGESAHRCSASGPAGRVAGGSE